MLGTESMVHTADVVKTYDTFKKAGKQMGGAEKWKIEYTVLRKLPDSTWEQ